MGRSFGLRSCGTISEPRPSATRSGSGLGRSELIAITGNDALTGFTAPKILWVRNNEPDVFARVAHVLLPKDYVRFRLTDTYAIDRAGGSGTILFDLAARDWSTEVARVLDIPMEWLPPTFEGPDVTGVVTEEAAALTGLRPGTPVMAGGGDQAANGVGVGAIAPGVVAMSVGTSGVVFAAADRPVVEPAGRLHAFCHAVPGMWHLMGVMLSAAGSYKWFKETFAPDLTYDELNDAAAQVPAGSEGLVFLPYLTGERTPHPDPLARGAFVGSDGPPRARTYGACRDGRCRLRPSGFRRVDGRRDGTRRGASLRRRCVERPVAPDHRGRDRATGAGRRHRRIGGPRRGHARRRRCRSVRFGCRSVQGCRRSRGDHRTGAGRSRSTTRCTGSTGTSIPRCERLVPPSV